MCSSDLSASTSISHAAHPRPPQGNFLLATGGLWVPGDAPRQVGEGVEGGKASSPGPTPSGPAPIGRMSSGIGHGEGDAVGGGV